MGAYTDRLRDDDKREIEQVRDGIMTTSGGINNRQTAILSLHSTNPRLALSASVFPFSHQKRGSMARALFAYFTPFCLRADTKDMSHVNCLGESKLFKWKRQSTVEVYENWLKVTMFQWS